MLSVASQPGEGKRGNDIAEKAKPKEQELRKLTENGLLRVQALLVPAFDVLGVVCSSSILPRRDPDTVTSPRGGVGEFLGGN